MKITKTQLKQIIKEELGRVLKGQSHRGKNVDRGSFEIDGIDHSDYPDYANAHLSYGQYTDGTEMTDKELQAWQDDNSVLFDKILQGSIH